MNEAWSDAENDHIVADYFDMLSAELAGIRYNKTAHRNALIQKLENRSHGSIEFKHQNISAVMLGLNQPWIEGYKPAKQFQLSLVDAILRRSDTFNDWNKAASNARINSGEPSGVSKKSFRDPGSLYVGPAPTLKNRPPDIDPKFGSEIARRYNAAERDEYNRALGEAGEEFTLEFERISLRSVGRSDLATQIQWTSKVSGDGAGYDIYSFNSDGSPRLIEVKTTNGYERAPFHISRNELAVADANRSSWILFRLYDFARQPKAFEIKPPLQRHVELTPTSFLANLN